MTKAPNIKRWSDQKLEMELGFAFLALDENHPENVAWLTKLKIESLRRKTIGNSAAA